VRQVIRDIMAGWTLIHILPPDSEVLAALQAGEPLLLSATVSGTDMLLASVTQSLQKYSETDVCIDHEFSDMVFDEEDGVWLDLNRLDLVQPLTFRRWPWLARISRFSTLDNSSREQQCYAGHDLHCISIQLRGRGWNRKSRLEDHSAPLLLEQEASDASCSRWSGRRSLPPTTLRLRT
jgi:hypothetical protein